MVVPTYQLILEKRKDYLYAHVKADSISEQLVRAYLSEVRDAVRQEACERVMIERDIPGTLPDAVIFNISKDTAQWFRGVKVAIVNRHIPFHDSLRFSMNVAANRGGTNELFADEATAEKWLML